MKRACAVLLVGLLAACSSGGDAAPVAQATATALPSVPVAPPPSPAAPCPDGGDTDSWPAGVPTDLPVPPTAAVGGIETNPDGLTLVRFTTSQSVRQGVVFLASALQPAGYTLGRGDAEAIEADVPFTKGEVRGLMKMIAQQECQTQWILALQTAPTGRTAPAAPLLPPVTTVSPSPLPFG